jgi:hypothetical protein
MWGWDAERDALRAGVRRSCGAGHDLPHHAASASGCPILAASPARLVDAKWVETQLELAGGTVVDYRLEAGAGCRGVRGRGAGPRPDRRARPHAGFGREHGLTLDSGEPVTQLGHTLLELVVALVELGQALVIMSLRVRCYRLACSTRLPSWRHRSR